MIQNEFKSISNLGGFRYSDNTDFVKKNSDVLNLNLSFLGFDILSQKNYQHKFFKNFKVVQNLVFLIIKRLDITNNKH